MENPTFVKMFGIQRTNKNIKNALHDEIISLIDNLIVAPENTSYPSDYWIGFKNGFENCREQIYQKIVDFFVG